MATVSMRRLVLLAVVASGAALVLPGRPLHAPRRALAAAAPLAMSDIGKDYGGNAGGGSGEGERQRGRSAVIARPKPKAKDERKEDTTLEPMWRVLLHNDDVHTWDYVIMAIVETVKTITRKKAHRITTQVHSQGVATITVTWKQQAKTFSLKLQNYGLTSSICPDESPKT